MYFFYKSSLHELITCLHDLLMLYTFTKFIHSWNLHFIDVYCIRQYRFDYIILYFYSRLQHENELPWKSKMYKVLPRIGTAIHCCHWQGQQLGPQRLLWCQRCVAIVPLSTMLTMINIMVCTLQTVLMNCSFIYVSHYVLVRVVHICIAVCELRQFHTIQQFRIRYLIIISEFCLITCFDNSTYCVNGRIAQIKITTFETEWLVHYFFHLIHMQKLL